MQMARAAGRNAAALKYDLLTALGAHGCAGDKHLQRLVLRFITLVVARYNWQSDELSVGQREMAALWSVDERTVKRDMARLRDLGWLVIKRPAVRGRVAVYGLGLAAILSVTSAVWPRVGSDFASRMEPPQPTQAATNVIAFPSVAPSDGQGVWDRAQAVLHSENPALFAAWFSALTEDAVTGNQLHLRAPSRFHATFVTTHHLQRLSALVRSIDSGLESVHVTG